MGDIPETHPRRDSLISRQKLVDAATKGMLADSALIAHGRGEAFDYLLGETTCEAAKLAIAETASRLQKAKKMCNFSQWKYSCSCRYSIDCLRCSSELSY